MTQFDLVLKLDLFKPINFESTINEKLLDDESINEFLMPQFDLVLKLDLLKPINFESNTNSRSDRIQTWLSAHEMLRQLFNKNPRKGAQIFTIQLFITDIHFSPLITCTNLGYSQSFRKNSQFKIAEAM